MTPPDSRPSIRAAGGIVLRAGSDGKPEYLIAHRPRYNDWSLPKGKLNPKESYLRAALREVWEETGYHGKDPVKIGSIGYDTAGGKSKLVRWWSMTAGKGKFQTNSEVDAVEWLPARKAFTRLQYRNDRNILDRAKAVGRDPTASIAYLVRHAHAGPKRRSSDARRPLIASGREQAYALARDLRRTPITRIITSDSRRCAQTLEPLATRLSLERATDPRVGADAGADDAMSLLSSLSGESVAIATHGEVIGAVIGKLGAEGIDLDGPLEWKKGSMWVVELRGGSARSARYVPPPEAAT